MTKAKSVIDVILGEAVGERKNFRPSPRQRRVDMEHIASVIYNRAEATGVTPQEIVANTREFNAYNKSIPRGAENFRNLAVKAWNKVNTSGPITDATFYSVNGKGLPKGLERVGSTAGHVFFIDPQNRAIGTAQGYQPIVNDILASADRKGRGLQDVADVTGQFTGYDPTVVDPSLHPVMEAIASNPNIPDNIEISSTRRSVKQNRDVKGANKSQHLLGKAVDIKVAGWNDAQKQALVETAAIAGAKGFGIYKSGNKIHVDTRPEFMFWGQVPGKKGYYSGNKINQAPQWAKAALRHAAGVEQIDPVERPEAYASVETPVFAGEIVDVSSQVAAMSELIGPQAVYDSLQKASLAPAPASVDLQPRVSPIDVQGVRPSVVAPNQLPAIAAETISADPSIFTTSPEASPSRRADIWNRTQGGVQITEPTPVSTPALAEPVQNEPTTVQAVRPSQVAALAQDVALPPVEQTRIVTAPPSITPMREEAGGMEVSGVKSPEAFPSARAGADQPLPEARASLAPNEPPVNMNPQPGSFREEPTPTLSPALQLPEQTSPGIGKSLQKIFGGVLPDDPKHGVHGGLFAEPRTEAYAAWSQRSDPIKVHDISRGDPGYAGSGSNAIQAVISGRAPFGFTATSRSNPDVTVTSLGNLGYAHTNKGLGWTEVTNPAGKSHHQGKAISVSVDPETGKKSYSFYSPDPSTGFGSKRSQGWKSRQASRAAAEVTGGSRGTSGGIGGFLSGLFGGPVGPGPVVAPVGSPAPEQPGLGVGVGRSGPSSSSSPGGGGFFSGLFGGGSPAHADPDAFGHGRGI